MFSNADVAYYVTRNVCKYTVALLDQLEEVTLRSSEARLSRFLIANSDNSHHVAIGFNQSDIGEPIGLSRRRVATLLKGLKKQRLIKVSREEIQILEPNLLLKFAEAETEIDV